MLEISELQIFLTDQSNIIIDLNISMSNMNRLVIEKYEYENQIKRHGFFAHHIYQLKFIMIIQLSKIFSDKKGEKRSFHKLCNKLESSDYGSSLKKLFEDNKDKFTAEVKSREDLLTVITEVRSLLNTHNSLIKRVEALRDKVYAHIDKSAQVQNVTFDELKLLVELANRIHNLVRFRLFFWQTMFDHTRDWDIDYILWYMSEFRKKDLEELERKKKGTTETN
ncbi:MULTISPECIES: hypothetical protein [unclassified Spirosoma]|uniref:AbiU2 domain-containing protein n=1 Tax=unclassified Spirosoma TaxID=2621999 RepID=UPI0009675B61|nr:MULTISPECIES: hypothetical protein [unclassified Spirosoma]MBN8821858.1 hypothetical protein [Spirosoma sp.]OJW80656.1 MAG: hypothetical protein BGO59_34900 [Spirosoma sp. 48-14]